MAFHEEADDDQLNMSLVLEHVNADAQHVARVHGQAVEGDTLWPRTSQHVVFSPPTTCKLAMRKVIMLRRVHVA